MVWTSWCDSTSTSTINDSVWVYWHEIVSTSTIDYVPSHVRRAEDAERAEARARINSEVQRRQEERKRADNKARALLLSLLNPEQRKEFEQHGHFVVHGRQARYRIRQGRSGNVDVIDRRGIVSHRLCVHPAMDVPDCDTMAAQLLMLRAAEDEMVRAANRHEAFGTPRPVLPALQ